MKKLLCILSCVLWGISAHSQTLVGTMGAIGVAGILHGMGSNAGSIGMGAVNGMQQGLPSMMGGNTPGLGGLLGGSSSGNNGGTTAGVRPPGGTGGNGATAAPAPTPPTPNPSTPNPSTLSSRRSTGVLNLRPSRRGVNTPSASAPRVQRISLRAPGTQRIATPY